jgi:16S rRNA (guanine966-N2)-methyltransferase
LSRGAQEAVFIDNGREARDLLRRNIDTLGLADRTRIMAIDITRLTANTGAPYDVVFCDAPYGKGMTDPVLDALARGHWLPPDAVLVVETAAEEALNPPPALRLINERRYGKGKIGLLKVADHADGDR